ncbi:MAG: hypothetical protein M3M88_05095 [Thermoproteota archaeon]|nr:hypothetical protein [Thermoproteota archaeon]
MLKYRHGSVKPYASPQKKVGSDNGDIYDEKTQTQTQTLTTHSEIKSAQI